MNNQTKAGWKFDNSYPRLPDSLFSIVNPSPVQSPKIAILNHQLAQDLGLHNNFLASEDGIAELSGNNIPDGALPIAQAYAGHQFGYFTMLGDGRAILLGEHITPSNQRFDVQLKGSGRTPYSRRGDGKATLGPMLREYIISEAMHSLGIPTTRGLAVVTTGESIQRESILPGAILTRIASSHIRVGTFQFVAKWGTIETLRTLADYTIERHFPDSNNEENKYLYLLKEVIRRQAILLAKWLLVGFVHGVMNTDNMTISGETIDYGPCAFMDTYDPKTVFSSIDANGRYAYGNQPRIAEWNLARFAETLLPLLHQDPTQAVALAEEAVSEFNRLYEKEWLTGMRAKLGVIGEEEEDSLLIHDLLNLMQQFHEDYTNTFLALTFRQFEKLAMNGTKEFTEWYRKWLERLKRTNVDSSAVLQLMKDNNPAVIPRNHRVEEALQAAVKGDYHTFEKLLHVLSNPFAHAQYQEEYASPPLNFGCAYQTFCGT